MRKMPFLSLLVLAACLLFFSCDSEEQADSPKAVVIKVPEDLLGASGSTGDEGGGERPEAWNVIHELGIQWVTRMFRWGDFQKINHDDPDDPEAGWNWTEMDTYVRTVKKNGMKIIGTIGCDDKAVFIDEDFDGRWTKDPGHFVPVRHIPMYEKYVKKLVQHYSYNDDPELKVDAWEIWNEGNFYPTWWYGTHDEFYKLHKAVSEAVREVNPDVPLLGFCANSINYDEWTKNLVSGGFAPKDKLNGAAFHPYAKDPAATMMHMQIFGSRVAAGGFDEIWVTEVGYPYGGMSYPTIIDRKYNASFTVATIALLAANNVPRILWYQFSKNGLTNRNVNPHTFEGNDPEDYFQMTWWYHESDNNWKCKYEDSAIAYTLASKHIPGSTYRSNLPKRQGIPDSVESLYFEGKNGSHALLLWNTKPTTRTVKVTLPGTDQTLHDMDYDTWDRTDSNKPKINPKSIEGTTTIELKTNVVKFYSWKNTGSTVPVIAGQ